MIPVYPLRHATRNCSGQGGGEGFLEQIRVEKHSIYKTRKKSPAWKLSGVFPEILLNTFFPEKPTDGHNWHFFLYF